MTSRALVAENLFRRLIEGFDDAALVNGDDALDRRFQNRAQPLLAVAQRGRGLLALRPGPRGMFGFEVSQSTPAIQLWTFSGSPSSQG